MHTPPLTAGGWPSLPVAVVGGSLVAGLPPARGEHLSAGQPERCATRAALIASRVVSANAEPQRGGCRAGHPPEQVDGVSNCLSEASAERADALRSSPDPHAKPCTSGCSAHVRRRLYQGRLDAPKSRYGRRAVPLSPRLAQALWRRRGASPDEAPVFASRSGDYLNDSNLLARVLKPAAKRAGVPWTGFHTFRHTCATMLFATASTRSRSRCGSGITPPLSRLRPTFTCSRTISRIRPSLTVSHAVAPTLSLHRSSQGANFRWGRGRSRWQAPRSRAGARGRRPGWAGMLEVVEVELGSTLVD